MDEILVREYRGGILENVHRGRICGVGADKQVNVQVGDVEMPAFWRSCAKPIQAIPRVMRAIDERLAFTDQETAITVSSHRAEPFHMEALASLMGKAGLQEAQLACPPTYPTGAYARERLLQTETPPRALSHNCSGKHLGVLALCKQMGWPTENYCDIGHPAQQEMAQMLALMADCPPDKMHCAIDGCGFPVFAMPLYNLAIAYLKLACPELIGDEQVSAAVRKITRAMNREYKMVAGTGRVCSILLQDDNIVAKGGANGIYCFGLKREKLGFAIKVSDGSEEAWPFVIASILAQIGYSGAETLARLANLAAPERKNGSGAIVGAIQTAFRI